MDVLKIKNLYKKFKDKEVLNDISFELKESEVLTIIGPSGTGKSTLLRIIGGLEVADRGNINIFGEDVVRNGKYIKNKNIKKMYEKISYIFQDFNLFDNMNVEKNITLAPSLRKQENTKEKARMLLEKVGLLDKLNAYPNTLSGGEKQRVAIARALAMDPKLILFDEPTSALDVESVQALVYTINEMKKQGITMIVVTHDLSFAKKVGDRLIFMENAKILGEDSKRMQEFLNN